MEKYNRGKVYKLVSDKSNLVYYGSTICKLSIRLAKHRYEYKKNLSNEKSNKTAYKLLELGDAKIILVEDFPCERKEQLLARERHYIENNPCVNKCIPITNMTAKEYNKEWRIKNKDKKREMDRIYKAKNKEKLKEQSKLYREKNKEKLKERDRLAYQKNKEKRRKQMKQYNEKNKDKKKLYDKERYEKKIIIT